MSRPQDIGGAYREPDLVVPETGGSSSSDHDGDITQVRSPDRTGPHIRQLAVVTGQGSARMACTLAVTAAALSVFAAAALYHRGKASDASDGNEHSRLRMRQITFPEPESISEFRSRAHAVENQVPTPTPQEQLAAHRDAPAPHRSRPLRPQGHHQGSHVAFSTASNGSKLAPRMSAPRKPSGLITRVEDAEEWEVIHPGKLNIRKEKKLDSDVLGTKIMGTIVVGRTTGDDWLALIRQPGFMRINLGEKEFLKKRVVSYLEVGTGHCTNFKSFPIYDANTCQNAGFLLGYFDTRVGIYDGEGIRPEGCYVFDGQLWLAAGAKHIGQGAQDQRKLICSSNSYPTTTTTTTSTTTVTITSTLTHTTITSTSTSSTTWGSPSLFCIEVVRIHGYELPMVKEQQRMGASIFGCEEYAVFSDGNVRQEIGIDGGGRVIRSIVIPQIKRKAMGNLQDKGVTTNSWLNTQTFLQVWTLLEKLDRRYAKHDWVVKVDPDAVFFPHRLRVRLKAHTFTGGNLFVMNCDKWKPIALYGSLEIFSILAFENYLRGTQQCQKNLPWHGWGEDYFMSHCFDMLKVGRLNDFSLIGDKRCHYAPCTDQSKVVYHDYKNLVDWKKCWHDSNKAENR